MLKRHSDEDLSHDALDWSLGANGAPETGLFTSIRALIHPRELPGAASLNDVDLISLLNDIEFDLMQNRIHVDFLDRLPARVAYRGLLQLLDSPIDLADSAFAIKHIDGCDSACESCFQLAHCNVARQVLGADWTLAVAQAGINPSWSALFSGEAAKEDEE